MPNPPDDVTTPIDGPYGTARNVTAELHAAVPDGHAGVATFRLECPGQSPGWSSYILAAVHLRAEPGVPAPIITTPGATHELLLMALDPDRSDGPPPWPWLTPINATVQIEVPDDHAAAQVTWLMAWAIVTGHCWAEPPLSGQREPFRSIALATAEHYRPGGHAA